MAIIAPTANKKELREHIFSAVQEMYTEVASCPTKPFHFPTGRWACEFIGYPKEELDAIPQTAVESFAGVGYPFRANQSFYGAGQEDTSRSKPFVLEGDEPPVLLGENDGPNAIEAVLHALASCLSVGFIYNAAAQDIHVEELEFNLEGDIDLYGFLGLSDRVRPGYQNIQLTYKVKADAPEEKLVELCDYVQKTSPVLDIIRNPVQVSINLEKN